MVYILLGCPGSGKATIATHLKAEYKIKHISYRKAVHDYMAGKKATAVDKENWLAFRPFDAEPASEILISYLEKNADSGFVLEGYPKSAEEAKLFTKYLNKKFNGAEIVTFSIDTSKEKAVERLNSRTVCPDCSYVCPKPNPLKILGNYCPNCHLELIKRQDDNDDRIEYRIDRFEKEKNGIITELEKVSTIVKIDGQQTLAEVISDIVEYKENSNQDKLSLEAERGARMLVEGLGLDLADPNMVRTPKRIVNTYRNLLKGIVLMHKKK